jgi:hypothetical protein
MTDRTLNPEATPGAVALAQLRMIVRLQKRDLLILGALVIALVALALWGQMRMDPDSGGTDDTIPMFPGLTIPRALVGAFWPLGVWRADPPERRGYFWSLPVERRRHTLVRAAAGGVVLLAVCLLIMATAVVSLVPSLIRFEGLRLDLGGAWQPLATATLAYISISALTVLFDSPIRWLAFAWLGVLGLFIVAEAADLDGLSEGVEDAVGSLFIALGGPIVTDRESVAEWSRHYFIWLAIGAAAFASAVLWRHEEK